MLAVKSGKAIRFEENKTRPMGRNASGVRGIRLKDDKDEVVGMISVNDMDANILVVSENGFGKRSSLEDYRLTNRGGKGVKTISITEKTGKLVTLKSVSDNDDLMIIKLNLNKCFFMVKFILLCKILVLQWKHLIYQKTWE